MPWKRPSARRGADLLPPLSTTTRPLTSLFHALAFVPSFNPPPSTRTPHQGRASDCERRCQRARHCAGCTAAHPVGCKSVCELQSPASVGPKAHPAARHREPCRLLVPLRVLRAPLPGVTVKVVPYVAGRAKLVIQKALHPRLARKIEKRPPRVQDRRAKTVPALQAGRDRGPSAGGALGCCKSLVGLCECRVGEASEQVFGQAADVGELKHRLHVTVTQVCRGSGKTELRVECVRCEPVKVVVG